MPRFFLSPEACGPEGPARLTGSDARHIGRSLRMRAGDNVTVCDGQGTDYFCEITAIGEETVDLKVLYHTPTACEPTVRLTLYQGLPKGDKLEWIIQKAVELGAARIVPVQTARSVSRVSDRDAKKQARWQKIADEAAGQCGRGILPAVEAPLSFRTLLERLDREEADTRLLLYEGGGEPLSRLVDRNTLSASLFIGPEGGFDPEEVAALSTRGARAATLGKRIRRCETAPLAALSVVLALTGNME